jgi:hypothetical protein
MTVCGRSRHWCLDAVGTPNTGRLSNCEPPVNNPAAGVRQFRAFGKPGVTEDTERRSARRPAGFQRARRTPVVSQISSPRSNPDMGVRRFEAARPRGVIEDTGDPARAARGAGSWTQRLAVSTARPAAVGGHRTSSRRGERCRRVDASAVSGAGLSVRLTAFAVVRSACRRRQRPVMRANRWRRLAVLVSGAGVGLRRGRSKRRPRRSGIRPRRRSGCWRGGRRSRRRVGRRPCLRRRRR